MGIENNIINNNNSIKYFNNTQLDNDSIVANKITEAKNILEENIKKNSSKINPLKRKEFEGAEEISSNKKRKYKKHEEDKENYAVPLDPKELTPKKTTKLYTVNSRNGTQIRVNLNEIYNELGPVNALFYRFKAGEHVYVGASIDKNRPEQHAYAAEYFFEENDKSLRRNKKSVTLFHKFIAMNIREREINVGRIPILKADMVSDEEKDKYKFIQGLGNVETYLIEVRNTKYCPFKNPTGLNTNKGGGGLGRRKITKA